MGLFTRSKNGDATLAEQEFIDLRAHEGGNDGGSMFNVRVAEMRKIEDMKAISGLVYEGDLLIIDISALADDEVALKRVTKEFKRIAKDVAGDVAGLGSSTLIVAPTGVQVDRRKVRVAE